MEIFGINDIEHPAIAKDQAWFIVNKDSPQVPEDLRGRLPVPCLLTGSLNYTKNMLILFQAIRMGIETAESASTAQQLGHLSLPWS